MRGIDVGATVFDQVYKDFALKVAFVARAVLFSFRMCRWLASICNSFLCSLLFLIENSSMS